MKITFIDPYKLSRDAIKYDCRICFLEHKLPALIEMGNRPYNAIVTCLFYIRILGHRIPEMEPFILTNRAVCDYAQYVIKGRWPEAEPVIAKDSWTAYRYAEGVIKGRWPEAEDVIAKDSRVAYIYAKDVIKGRWPEAEPVIAKASICANMYAKDVIKAPWPEAGIYNL